MKTDIEQLSTYKSVHLNKKNITTHFIGVPMIVWAVMALMSLVSLPIPQSFLPFLDSPITLAPVFFIIVSIYYFKLNTALALGQFLFTVPALYVAHLVSFNENAVWIATFVFVVGWIIQFIGHYYEKAKPAFADDINQLLIGPMFVTAEIFFIFGSLQKLDKAITPLAIEKRRAFEAQK